MAWALAALFLALAARGITTGSSYWLDEMYSVSAAQLDWPALYGTSLLSEPHPPLYTLLLKLWVGVVGSSEPATRCLSLAAAALTLASLAWECRRSREPRRLLALVLVGVSPAFVVYAQETRSYSLNLCLATLVTLLALRRRERHRLAAEPGEGQAGLERGGYEIGCLLLSLLHYFGWLYVAVLCCLNLGERLVEPQRRRTLLLLALISVWPIWHVLNGGLLGQTGGHFWIRVQPLVGSLNAYLYGSFPILSASLSRTSLFVWSLVLAIVLLGFGRIEPLRRLLRWPARQLSGVMAESRFLLLTILLFLAAVSLIDLHTPISTSRNDIVLLPATALLLANAWSGLARPVEVGNLRSWAALLLAGTWIALLLSQSQTELSRRLISQQNWKGLAAYVRASGVCSQGCFVAGGHGLHRFYFGSQDPLLPLPPSRQGMAALRSHPDWPILGFHAAPSEVRQEPDGHGALSSLRRDGTPGERICLQPRQDWADSTFILLPRQRLSGQEARLGLVPCTSTGGVAR